MLAHHRPIKNPAVVVQASFSEEAGIAFDHS